MKLDLCVNSETDAARACGLVFGLHETAPCKVVRMTGGLSNVLYKVTLPNGESVLVRQQSEEEGLVDSLKEMAIIQALQRPKLFGLFRNGIIYEFYPGRTLQANELRTEKMQVHVAKKMASWHALKPKGIPPKGSSTVFQTTLRWLTKADPNQNRVFEGHKLTDIKAEVELMERECAKLSSPIVFSHNDLLAGNIILSEGTDGKLIFIDYEYASYNYRGFDLGNHFCEYAGYGLDYDTFYPTFEQQANFLKSYLGDKANEESIAQLALEADAFSLLSHLKWSVWAICRHDSELSTKERERERERERDIHGERERDIIGREIESDKERDRSNSDGIHNKSNKERGREMNSRERERERRREREISGEREVNKDNFAYDEYAKIRLNHYYKNKERIVRRISLK